ncbi:MAG: NifB/NifX family molybdenum-iron cluster-binding protein [Coriobacteriia bacterium]|nr:NifB/NifX family molybdenum-iron cluster-binding protein [Coriobacteriia bacterium]
MKVVVSSVGPTLQDLVDERFGRAMYFVVADTGSSEFEAVDNSVSRNAMQGAGIASAEFVSERGAEAVVTGHLGPKAFAALRAAGVKGYSGSGMTVGEAIAALAEGSLRELTEAGEAHAG